MTACSNSTLLQVLPLLLYPPNLRWSDSDVQGLWQVLVLFLVVYGAPANVRAFALPSACTAYSNVDAHDINIGGTPPGRLDPLESVTLGTLSCWHGL